MTHQAVTGCFEPVRFPEFDIEVMAKIDTGAYSGAIHCTDIHIVRRGKERERVLRFTLLNGMPQETTHFASTYVRSATGHRVRRHIIETTIEVHDMRYPIHIGLSDRSDMKSPVLLGRRFLRENGMIVDVRINQEYDDERENTK